MQRTAEHKDGETWVLSDSRISTETATPQWLKGKESTCNAGDAGDKFDFLGQEDPLDEEMATHSSILAWKIPSTEWPSDLEALGLQRAGHEHTHMHACAETPHLTWPPTSRRFM